MNHPDPVTLTNLHIWDGARHLEADTLQFCNGLITSIEHTETHNHGRGAIDCSGLTAIPGLTDAHVHMELNPDNHKPPESTEEGVIPLMQERAAKMARAGITTARDLGGGAWFELALRDSIARGELPGPRLLCSGQPITSPKGHCHFWGGEAANLAAAKGVLSRQVEKGVDLIKVMATGGRMTAGSNPADAQFSQSTLDAIVELARDHQLPVAAHCHGTEGIHRAAVAGVNTIEHCSWVGKEGWGSGFQDDIARVMLENGVWVSPTVSKGWRRMLDNGASNGLERLRSAYNKMFSMGIRVVASTDAGIPGVFHEDLAHALVVFAEIAQLSAEAALVSATSDASRALGIDHFTGTIAVNKAADLLLVDGDPTVDLSAVTRPVSVYCRGLPMLENS